MDKSDVLDNLIDQNEQTPTGDNAVGQKSVETSVGADWTKKLFFDRSFSAKLILSDDKVKEYYADIASELLKYAKVKSKTSWNGVSFVAGRSRIAYVSIVGKTLCLYLSIDPEQYSEGKYRVKNVGEVKNKAKTPSLLKIKSDGAKRYAVTLIAKTAENFGLSIKDTDGKLVDASNFKTDTFNNLITRGLVRILRNKKTVAPSVEQLADPDYDPDGEAESSENPVAEVKLGAYDDTVKSLDELASRHGVYDEILESLSEGYGKIGLTNRKMLRSVDEIWVRAIEDCLPALDELIRNPNHYIAETEEVLPIELTKKISGRSITHLGRHTDYLTENSDGEITPTKMLNIFRDDSVLTYENKFLNTLVNRLYSFVAKRYKVAKEYGADEVIDCFEYENSFTHGDGKGKIKISIEYSERNLDKDVKNVLVGTGLWNRVERLYSVVTGYLGSSFIKTMDKNFVRPPIMRTNAIIKNKYFRSCLALWEFIESYDDAGYGVTSQETVKTVSNEYVRQTYVNASALYLEFRKNAENEEFAVTRQKEYKPVYKPENTVFEGEKETFEEDKIERVSSEDTDFALRVAMFADEWIEQNDPKIESTGLRKTFHAKIRLADQALKENFAYISNELLKYDRVKMRHSRRFATYSYGRTTLCKIVVSEKSLKLYLGIDPDGLDSRYNVKNASEKPGFVDTPSMLLVRSRRSLKYAKELIDALAEDFGLTLSKKETILVKASDYATEPLADMIEKGWIKVTENPRFKSETAISFGPHRKEITAINAEQVKKNVVLEASSLEQNVSADVSASPAVKVQPSAAERLKGIVRPEGNYAKPTEYGLDDPSGFLSDEKTSDD